MDGGKPEAKVFFVSPLLVASADVFGINYSIFFLLASLAKVLSPHAVYRYSSINDLCA